jgi:PPOX class probable F420-dependent enzyme
VSLTPELAAAGSAQFVSLTTFRPSGAPVATPVWVARDGDALVVTTPVDTGKVRRLRHDPRVELQACSRRGTVAEGVMPAGGVADVLPAAAAPTAVAALRAKYGLSYRLASLVERLVRRRHAERAIIRITAPDTDAAR